MSRIGFSTSFKRAISAYYSSKKQKERKALIAQQSTKQTKAGPFYSISSFDFNKNTRILRITFNEQNKYKKIIKYVTINYVRHPIYSDSWTIKNKEIKKTIKLTNSELENLESNEDDLICEFRFEIVERLNDDNLVPSWLIKSALNEEMENQLAEEESAFRQTIQNISKNIQELENANKKEDEKRDPYQKLIKKYNSKIAKIQKKLEKYSSRKKNMLIAIVTFGIYAYLTSEKYRSNLSKKLKINNELLLENTNKDNLIVESIRSNNEKIKALNEGINHEKHRHKTKRDAIINECEESIAKIKPLTTDNSRLEEFVPLKVMVGLEYKKIIGCYVIHNIEKDKYYVGQSKDVYKRVLKEHFNGTKVKNVIFAEDYYSSSYENKDDIFEVKIIECGTKDELDRTEHELIKQYDSFKNGYNATSGNK